MPDIKALDAMNAYQRAAGSAAGLSGGPMGGAGGGVSPAGSFEDVLSGMVQTVAAPAERAETITSRSLNKQADLVDVVTAMNNAEVTLETVVAVRDKVIQAYNDILRMPI